MSAWSEVRRQARLRHQEFALTSDSLVSAAALLAAAEAASGIKVRKLPEDDPLLDGAVACYSRERQRIYYSASTDPALASFHVAHEFAHHWLDLPEVSCSHPEMDPTTPAEPEMSLVGETDAYSPKERAEARANLFAREFLLPRDKLNRIYRSTQASADSIARDVGVPPELVMQQMADALLLPPEFDEGPAARKEEPAPDKTQLEAINAPEGPHRVRAAPGTGKTRTLVGRVKKLIGDGVDPASILVLTYSNFAAQDLAQRIHAAVGPAAMSIWSGTFHAFGLELLRKYSVEAGFQDVPRPVDRARSLQLLDELLPKLNLRHYLDLVAPIMPMRTILSLISRAKDELATPEGYRELAVAMTKSDKEETREAGDKALEVADVYRVYETALRERGSVDFGDLIARPVEMFRANPAVRDAVRAKYQHILVDEYQDMNRASAVLLQEIVTPGRGPWVVGDVRQSIYRFRGASPRNLSEFEKDFPNATTTDLGVNYRSGGKIVQAFEVFGAGMQTNDTSPQIPLKPERGADKGTVGYDIGSTARAEFEGIAAAASSLAKGVKAGFSAQAVIARAHTTLAKLAAYFERRGIPCLYFGDFFERPEVRDMLCLLSLCSEGRGIGFYRVARFSQYAIPPIDCAKVFAWRRENKISMLDALQSHDQIPGLSVGGRTGLVQLLSDIGDVGFALHPHRLLLRYLFGTSQYLRDVLRDESVAAQQRRLAIYQLLQFSFAFRAQHSEEPKRAFLENVRQLEILDEEKQLRQLPAAAGGINAVRMMTVHASKGLEFPVVHLPFITSRHFPFNRTDSNPPPAGLIDETGIMSREAEEESLFYVAISRAKDVLNISRSKYHGGGAWKDVKPSPFLSRIKSQLPRPPDANANWQDEGLAEKSPSAPQPMTDKKEWSARAVESYLDCPRQFYYSEILNLGGHDSHSPYPDFHGALQSSIASLRTLPTREERASASQQQLIKSWEETKLKGHRLEALYHAAARNMISTALELLEGRSLPVEFALQVGGGVSITCKADHVGERPDGIIIRRLKASRLSNSEKLKPRFAMLQAAARQVHGANIKFEHASLLDGERQDGTADDKKLRTALEGVESAISGISSGAFGPTPSDYKCPRCPYYFICPAYDDAPATRGAGKNI